MSDSDALKMSYAEAIRERQQHAIITSDPKLIGIGMAADIEISTLKIKYSELEAEKINLEIQLFDANVSAKALRKYNQVQAI